MKMLRTLLKKYELKGIEVQIFHLKKSNGFVSRKILLYQIGVAVLLLF